MFQVFKGSLLTCWVFGGAGIICLFFSCGGFLAFYVAPSMEDRAAELQTLPTSPDVAVGQQAVLTGELSNNPTIKTDARVSNIATYELVAYEIERYDPTEGSRTRSGTWVYEGRVLPDLQMEVNGTLISFSGYSMTLPNETITYETSGNGQRWRVRGFRNGDLITMAGRRTADGRFEAGEIMGGTREQLIQYKESGATDSRYVGLLCLACGLMVMLVFGGASFMGWRAQQRLQGSEIEWLPH